MLPKVGQILKENDVRKTACREQILEEFVGKGFALSQPDLEKAVGADYDRVTIYRTLSHFLDKGILHKVLDDAGAMKFALCSHHCDDSGHQHQHVHFKCTVCGHTSCFDDLEIPRFQLPHGFSISETNLLVSGICNKCN